MNKILIHNTYKGHDIIVREYKPDKEDSLMTIHAGFIIEVAGPAYSMSRHTYTLHLDAAITKAIDECLVSQAV